MSQENRATPPEKGPVQHNYLFSSQRGCRTSSCLLEGVAVLGGVAATLSPVALQWGTLLWVRWIPGTFQMSMGP